MNAAKKHPERAGNVKCADSRDFRRGAAVSPKDRGYPCNRNAETCMEPRLSPGRAKAELPQK